MGSSNLLNTLYSSIRRTWNSLPIRWRLIEIGLVGNDLVEIMVARHGTKKSGSGKGYYLELRPAKSGSVDIIRVPLEEASEGKLVGRISAEEMALGIPVLVAFDLYLCSAERCLRLAATAANQPKVLRTSGLELLPWAKPDGHFSIILTRAASMPESGFDVAILLNQINYTGGKTKAMITLATQLKSQGFKVKIVVLHLAAEPPNFTLPQGVSVEFATSVTWRMRGEKRWSISSRYFVASDRAKAEARKYLSRLGARAVIVPDHSTIGFVDYIRDCLPADTRSILSDHNPHRATFVAKNGFLPTRTTEDRAFIETISNFDSIHIINPLLQPAIRERTNKDIILIPNGSARWEECRPEAEIFASRTVLALNRLTASKRVDHLIDAFAKIARGRPDWKLLILGRGPENTKLKKLVKARGLSRQILLEGFDPNIDDRFRSAAFMVSAARLENLSLAYLEAMGTGTPIVSYDGNATARYLNSESERLFLAVPDGDIDALAAAIDHMMQRVEDRDPSVARMSTEAYAFSERFSPDLIALQWKTALSSVQF